MDTRLVAINDQVDTFTENWRMNAFFSTFRHEGYNRDTSSRIRRSLRNRHKNGGILNAMVYGYIKAPGIKSDEELRKDPNAEPVL